MTRLRFFVFASAVLAFAAIGLDAFHAWSLRAEDGERRELDHPRAAVGAALRRSEARVAAAERECADLAAELKAPETPRSAGLVAPGVVAITPATPPAVPSIGEQLQKNPAAQLSALAHERAHVLATYGALFRQLGLSADQIAKFQDNVLRKRERMMDLQAIIREQGLTWQDAAIQKLRQEGETEYAAAQRALLGDDARTQLEAYERTTWLREMMIGWAGGAVVVAREPFTAQQAEQLVHVMANASESYRDGGWPRLDEPGYWTRVEAEARKILSPTQFNYFTTAEPPLPVGARFQTEFYRQVGGALRADAATKKKAAARPGG